MIYTPENTSKVGIGVEVVDGKLNILRNLTYLDTETGEAERLVTDKDGRFLLNESGTDVLRERFIVEPIFIVEEYDLQQ